MSCYNVMGSIHASYTKQWTKKKHSHCDTGAILLKLGRFNNDFAAEIPKTGRYHRRKGLLSHLPKIRVVVWSSDL